MKHNQATFQNKPRNLCSGPWEKWATQLEAKFKEIDLVNAEIEYNELRGFAGRHGYPRGRCQDLVKLFRILKEILGESP